MTPRAWQELIGNAALAGALVLLAACGSAPPAPPKQLQEYARHTAVGLEKHRDGMIGEARSAFQRALARAELEDDAALIASALLNLGASELQLDQADAAGASYARASREARLAGKPGLDWQAVSGLAEATRRLGEPAKALALFAARPDPGKDLGEGIRLAAEIARARALADRGETAAALALLDTVAGAAKARPQPDAALAGAFHARATVLLASGQAPAAREAAENALQLDRQLHHPPSVADDHFLLGRIAAAQNKPAEAAHHFQRALGIFANTGQQSRLAATRAALGKLPAEPRRPGLTSK